MVKVTKKNKKAQAFRASKIVKACKKSGVPEPIAKTMAGMVSKKVKKRKTISSSAIKKEIFSIFDKISKAKKHWAAYLKKKSKKKTPKKRTAKRRKKRR